MGKLFILLTVAIIGFQGASAMATELTCYNDDSQDVLNQEELPSQWWRPTATPPPADCNEGPAVVIDTTSAFAPRVRVNGTVVYSSSSDPALDARISPSGAVAILTTSGSLLLYKQGSLSPWVRNGDREIREFRMARDGNLIAANVDGNLVVSSGGRARVIRTSGHVHSLFASRHGEVFALMTDGQVWGSSGAIYTATNDPARALKVAADGTAVWIKESGGIGSVRNTSLYRQTTDPAVSFKVNAIGQVAYLTREGRLGRDGFMLNTGVRHILQYKIHRDGSVSATDSDGHTHLFQ